MITYVFMVAAAVVIPGLFILFLFVNKANEDERLAYQARAAQEQYEREVAAAQAWEAEQFAQEYGRMQLQAELNARALARVAREARS